MINAADLERAIDKEVEHGWSFPPTIDSIRHIKKLVVVLLGLAEQFLINKKCLVACAVWSCMTTLQKVAKNTAFGLHFKVDFDKGPFYAQNLHWYSLT